MKCTDANMSLRPQIDDKQVVLDFPPRWFTYTPKTVDKVNLILSEENDSYTLKGYNNTYTQKKHNLKINLPHTDAIYI